jgi:penicillin-binding protein 2
MSYAAIANEGKLMKPLLIKEIFSNDGDIIETFKPEMVSQATIKPRTLKAITKGLYQVVNEPRGTAYWARGKGLLMAGKTGTSQVKSMTKKELFSKCSEMPYESRHHALFVAFAPYDNPKVATVAAIEHGCSGSGAAAPVVRDVMTTYMNKHHPELVKKNMEIEKRNFLREKRKREERQRLEEKKKEQEQQQVEQLG